MFNSEFYHEKYRIKSIRLPNWDYSRPGYYFVTICTKNKQCYFGDIIDDKMVLNELGYITKKYLSEIPKHFPFVFLDCYIIMPNHVHLVICIKHCRDAKFCVSTGNQFGPQSKNLASIIRGFKIGVKKYTTMNNFNFHWQKLYYEHIVRNEKDLNCIRDYIQNNPLNWNNDRNNI